ncbi:U3 small nucleolar RNA-associated protein 22 [Cryptococcus neoformans Bt1]|nr:U3 small nucleolar RNA-associated protein 22 [Cryptococcus neoformans var. grubii Bt1]
MRNMVAQQSLKRKAALGNGSGNKRGPALRQSSQAENENGLQKLGNESSISYDEEAMGQLEDPMIDPQDSSDGEGSFSDVDVHEEVSESEEYEQPTAGPSGSSKNLYKAPTLSEMEALRHVEETGGATFSLQLSELLESSLLPTAPHAALKDLLTAIHSRILGMSAVESLHPAKAIKRIGIKVPFPGPAEFSPLKNSKEIKWTLGWAKPEEVFIGGSWSVVGGYRKEKREMGGIDLVVAMPHGIFTPKDRLDYRYFHKRMFYLAVIFSELQQLATKEGELKGVKIEWSTNMADERRPIVVVHAGKDQGLKSKVEIRIHASIPSSLFPLSSLSPTKSLVRTTVFANTDQSNATPSPLYNTSILHDTLHKPHLLHLHRLSQLLPSNARTVDSFLALWRIWAKRRGIRRERGGSAWLAGMVLGWVINGGWLGGVSGKREQMKKVAGVGRGLGAWGALRAAWEFLAHTDFKQTPIFLHPPSSPSSFEHSVFLTFSHVFTDPTGLVNIFAGWDEGEIDFLRYHARETLAMLEDESGERFADVFLKEFDLGPAVFDEFFHVDISSARLPDDLCKRSEHPSVSSLAMTVFFSTLRQGLSNRVNFVHIRPISEHGLSVGLLLDPLHANRVLDIGPSSDKPLESEAFRGLWEEKAELRRFKDGSIAESVVWDLSRPEDAALIPSKIVRYLLEKHYSIPGDAVTSFSSSQNWLGLIQIPSSARDAITIKGSEKLGFRPMLSGYDSLYKVLKDIDHKLPLAVLNVQPSSPLLRYSSTFVPHPVDIHRFSAAPDCIKYIPSADVILQFESSPKWPDDLAAVQKVKLALFEKLARTLPSRLPETKAEIVFDAGASEIEDQASLVVMLPEGVSFRLRIYYEREKTMLERVLQEEKPLFATSLPYPPRRLVAPALAIHLERFHYLPAHHSSLAPMHHRYPTYSSACRLLKRWFAAHMLLGKSGVREEIVELIMAGVYLEPGRGKTPSSAVGGFMRAMELLECWDWRTEPLLIPIVSASSPSSASASGRVRFPAELKEEALKLFEHLRAKEKGTEAKEGSVHAWVVCTEQDMEGMRWTKGISKVVAARVGALAKATVKAVKDSVERGSLDVKALFITPLEHYDIIIHLSPKLLSTSAQSILPDPSLWEPHLKYRNLTSSSEESDGMRIDFDPAALFVDDLKRIYGDSLMFFIDRHGGDVVGGVWNLARDGARGLKSFLGWNGMPVKSEAELVEINKEAIIGEIARLGQDLVVKIERRR